MRLIKILLLSQFFYPDKLSTGKVLSELFLGINKKAFEVTAIAGQRMYQDQQTVLSDFEVLSGIKIYRVFKHQLSKNRTFGRLYNYIIFFLLCSFLVFKQKLYKKTDIIFSVSNPPIMPLLGAFLKTKQRKFVYLIHDLYPDIAIKMNVIKSTSILAKVMFRANQYIFSRADVIIVLGRDMKEYLIKNYRINDERVEVLTNWGTESSSVASTINSKFTIVYAGNIGRFHSFDAIINAASELHDQIDLVFIGEGAQKRYLEELTAQRKLDNISFRGYLDDAEYSQTLATADALLLSLEMGLAGLAVPSKFYMYLTFRKPIIALADKDTEIARVIKENDCGIVASPNASDILIEKLRYLIDNSYCKQAMGNNAYKTFCRDYRKETIIRKYEELFSGILKNSE